MNWAAVAKIKVDNSSPALPIQSCAIVLAEAGAIITISEFFASSM